MKNKPWRRDLAFYAFQAELPTRYTDVDTERHINNVAVLTLHAEARARLGLALFGRETWMENTRSLRTAGLETDFLQIAHYPAPVTGAVSLIALDANGYTLAAGLFQGGSCVGVQECRMGYWQAGEWARMPESILGRLREFGVREDGL